MLTLLAKQSDLNTQRLAVIWMRDNNATSVTIADPEFITSFSLNGNKLSIDNRI